MTADVRVSAALALALPLALATLLAAPGCSGPSGGELFAKGEFASGAAASLGGSSSAAAGTDSPASPGPGEGGVSPVHAGSTSGSSTTGGSADGGGSAGQSQGGALGGGGRQAIEPPVIESCEMLDGAVTNQDNGHCYRINAAALTFAAARDACAADGGHLVSVSSKAEDDFVHALLDASHWLGASDGRANGVEGVGPYSWVNGDGWDYTNWEDDQPNAVATNCPNENSGANCFEHCAYQGDSGDWNDRACWHMIASVCEWEPASE